MENITIQKFIELVLEDKTNELKKYSFGILSTADVELLKEKRNGKKELAGKSFYKRVNKKDA